MNARTKRAIIIISALLAILLLLKFGYNWYQKKYFAQIIEKKAKPALSQMEKKLKSNDKSYDIEATMRVISGLDRAMNNSENFNDLLMYMAKQDYSNVAPEVVESRKDLLSILTKLYAKQTELDDQQSFWKVAQSIGTIVGDKAVNLVTLDINPLGTGLSGVNQTLNEIKKRKEITTKLKTDITEIQDELVQYVYKYSESYNKYIREWDKLCVDRDRAYLAVSEGNFDEAQKALDNVLKNNPNDNEAQILKAFCIIEGNANVLQQNAELSNGNEALQLLDNYIARNNVRSAPAFLLKGNYFYKKGDFKSASLNWKEASTYYPKQAEYLTDMLNPYEMRTYLKKSKEGNIIANAYKSTMLGSGYFSSDLQMAKAMFEKGEFEQGKKKVLDHFSRRRAQSQWDNIFADISYCEKFMGIYFKQIFPEQSYLDLSADVTTFGNKLAVEVNNRSDKKLTNASLILCLQFTDMHRDDYATFKMNTIPTLEANSKNDFGKMKLEYMLFGKKKTADDIAKYRAVLISDEAVSWVDNTDFTAQKSAEVLDITEQNGVHDFLNVIQLPKEKIKELIVENAILIAKQNLVGNDDINIELPRQLAVLQPSITIKKAGSKTETNWNRNTIENGKINVNFKTDVETKDKGYVVQLKSRFFKADVTFEGDITKGFKLKNVDMK